MQIIVIILIDRNFQQVFDMLSFLFFWELGLVIFRFHKTFAYIDKMKVIIIIWVESTEHQQAASNETSWRSPSRFGQGVRRYFENSESLFCWIEYEKIVEICTESTTENIDFIVETSWTMSPPRQQSGSFGASFFPS